MSNIIGNSPGLLDKYYSIISRHVSEDTGKAGANVRAMVESIVAVENISINPGPGTQQNPLVTRGELLGIFGR